MTIRQELQTGTEDCGQQISASADKLYQVAAMLVGDPVTALELVEHSLAAGTADPCADAAGAQQEAESRLVEQALRRLTAKQGAAAIAVPEYALAGEQQACMDFDELDSAGVTAEQLNTALSGPHPEKMRQWLEALSAAERSVFVLRAVLGRNNAAAADALGNAMPGQEPAWTAAHVSQVYQATLCSLSRSSVNAVLAEGAAQ
jgi:hypothetical protein